MRKGQSRGRNAAIPGKLREKLVAFRTTLDGYKNLKRRQKATRAKSLSEYMRRQAETGVPLPMPPFEELRALRFEIIQLRADLRTVTNPKEMVLTLRLIRGALEKIEKFKS